MAEAVAVSIGTALTVEAAKALTKLVAARVSAEVKLEWGLKDQLEKLKKRFLYIHAFLQDLGSRNHEAEKSQLVNLCLKEVKDVAYLAEDVMDEYGYEMLRRKIELQKHLGNKFRSLFTVSNPIAFRFLMSHKVAKVHALLDQLDKKANIIGLKQVHIAQQATGTTRASSHNINTNRYREFAGAQDSQFVGREFDQDKLLEVLCSHDSLSRSLSIVAIIGMGGFGKTTLARKVYDNERVNGHFGKRIWICVSDNFDVKKLLKEMVESLTSCTCDLSNTEAIIRKLEENLKGKTFLLVLDDVWNTSLEGWDSLKCSLQRIGGLAGCVILVTARNREVATKAEAVYTHWLAELSEEDSWALFMQKMDFSDHERSCLEDIGRTIVDKCRGVPLAIKAIGGLLQSKRNRYEWESIEKSNIWDLPVLDEHEILPSLLLSFNHLPSPSLKQCFAYCGIFPKDCIISINVLKRMWSSQGFLQNDDTSSLTMEEISNTYIMILLNNSLLQVAEKDEFTDIMVGFKMHDLVHNLACYVSREDMMIWEAKDKLNDAVDCRHLVLNCKVETVSEFYAKDTMWKLRTLSAWRRVPGEFLVHARYLRTLRMVGLGIKEIPAAICCMKHLRYLDVSNNPIKSLPDSITKLYYLQTLRLLECELLKELPREFYKLVNLRVVPTSYPMFMSRGLQQLTSLEYLPFLHLRDEGWTIGELGPLNEVKREMHIEGLQYVKSREEARKAGLDQKTKIRELYLFWDMERAESSPNTDEDVLDGLEPHPGMRAIELCNFYGMMLPAWVKRMAGTSHGGNPVPFSNLRVLRLVNCRHCQQLPTLGQLPSLKTVLLSGFDVECIGNEFYTCYLDFAMCQSSNTSAAAVPQVPFFPALTRLEMRNFQKLTTWLPPPPPLVPIPFPCLESLLIVDCPQLQTVPMLEFPSLRCVEIQDLRNNQPLDIIIRNNNSLTSLNVSDMSEMSSLPQELSNCTNLINLEIQSCAQLMSFPSGLQGLISLKKLNIRDCLALTCLPDDVFSHLSSLRELNIGTCKKLTGIPTSLQGCTSLERLYITECPLIEDPVPDLSLLVGLVDLSIIESGKLMDSLLETVQHLPCLRCLGIGGFRDEEEMKHYLSDVTPLRTLCNNSLLALVLSNCPSAKSLPQQLQLLTRLQQMVIMNFNELEQVPEWIGSMLSLFLLGFQNCENLKYLPSQAALLNLTQLKIVIVRDCPSLAERYIDASGEHGPEHQKISHVQYIVIDDVQHSPEED